MKVRLDQLSPNFCFAVYDVDTGEELLFAQSDYDYPALADLFGWHGTVDCEHKRAPDMLAEAYDFLAKHSGEVIDS